MAGEGLPQPSTDGRQSDRQVIQPGETELLTSPIEKTGSVLIRFWQGDADEVYVGWDEDVGPLDGFPLLEEEFVSLQIDASAQDIYATAIGGEADMRIISMN